MPARQPAADPAADPLWASAPFGLLAVDATGRVLAANPVARGSLGLDEAAVPLSWCVHAQDAGRIQAALDVAWAGGRPQPFLARWRAPEGGWRVHEARITLHGDGGTRRAVVWLTPDAPPPAASDALPPELPAMLAHQLRTPLATVRGSAELLRMWGDGSDPCRLERVLDRVEGAVEVMGEVLEELMLLGRVEAGPRSLDLEHCRLVPLVTTMVRARPEAAKVSVRSDDKAIGALVDRVLLRHIVDNLVANACKYADVVQVEILDGPCLRVVDRGRGIPAADLARVRAPCERGSNVGDVPGSGLGLALVERAVALLDGRFELDSREGEGTEARVWLRPVGEREGP